MHARGTVVTVRVSYDSLRVDDVRSEPTETLRSKRWRAVGCSFVCHTDGSIVKLSASANKMTMIGEFPNPTPPQPKRRQGFRQREPMWDMMHTLGVW